ncbi:unnamed protein product [Moneuplotes crassus]|uniref:Uncharacterized protein n=1 Tax=Euplotes crassus TaxID=5936 RepID=A0AAD1Y2U8_EUPCR|nr:unnamed protein product [Moneuplotes crassus]
MQKSAPKLKKKTEQANASGKTSFSSVHTVVKRSKPESKPIGMSSPLSYSSELNSKASSNKLATKKMKVIDQRKQSKMEDLIKAYFEHHSSDLREEVKQLKLEMKEMRSRLTRYEQILVNNPPPRSPNRVPKAPVTHRVPQNCSAPKRIAHIDISSRNQTSASRKQEVSGTRKVEAKAQKENRTPKTTHMISKLYQKQKGRNRGSKTYFSMKDESSHDDKADITFDNGKVEEIVLPVFTSHYTSKDFQAKNKVLDKIKYPQRKKLDSLETKLKRNKSLTSNKLKSVLLNLFDKKETLEADKNVIEVPGASSGVHTTRTDLMATFKSPVSIDVGSKRCTPVRSNLSVDQSIEKRGAINQTKLHCRNKIGYNINTPPMTEVRRVKQRDSLKSQATPLVSSKEECVCQSPRNFKDPDSKSCGNYCKYLSSDEQKDVIFRKYQAVCAQAMSDQFEYALPAEWWRIWCDFVNIEYKTLEQHCKDARVQAGSFNQCEGKAPGSTIRVSEESDMDFDSKIFEQDNIKPEESIHVLQSRDSNVGFKKDRFSIIPNDDRYNEIYTRPGKIINKVLIERSNADCGNSTYNFRPKESKLRLYRVKPRIGGILQLEESPARASCLHPGISRELENVQLLVWLRLRNQLWRRKNLIIFLA